MLYRKVGIAGRMNVEELGDTREYTIYAWRPADHQWVRLPLPQYRTSSVQFINGVRVVSGSTVDRYPSENAEVLFSAVDQCLYVTSAAATV